MAGYLFAGKTGISYQDLQDKRTRADLLAAQIMGRQPKTVAEGIGSVLQGIGVGINRYQANKGMRDGREQSSSTFDNILSRITGQPSSGGGANLPMPGAAGEIAATTPTKYSAEGSTFNPFMGAVKSGGLTNPYALAAVAATGDAESGWSAENANRTWSDPSESGKPGRAGGVMSWRGPRYNALAATGDLSAEGQAKFFMQENPQLIRQLQNAKSIEEAQQLMNNAWAFAGYDRPGGESGRRLSLAKGYLPQFQGGQPGPQVASLDPSAGMSGAAAIERQAPGSGYIDPQVSAPNAQPQQQMAPAQPPVPMSRPFDAGRFGDAPPALPMAPVADQRTGRLPQATTAAAAMPAPQAPQAPPVAPVSPTPAPAQAPMPRAPQMPQMQPYQIDPQVLRFLSSPFADEGQKQALRLAVEQQQAQHNAAQEQAVWQYRQEYEQYQRQADPSYQANLDRSRVETDRLRQGNRPITADERKAWGIADNRPYAMTPDGPEPIGGSGQTINFRSEIDARRQAATEMQIDPNSEEGKRYILTGNLPAGDRGVTAGDREAIRDADDQVQAATSVIEQLQGITSPGEGGEKSLNDRAGSGAFANWQSWAARNDPTGFFDDAKGEATTELGNTVIGQALSSLKSIFGSAPTEGERQILLDMQASVDKTPAERKIIIDKAVRLAERRLQFNRDRATDLRGGTYYKPNRAAPSGPVSIGGYKIEAE